MRLIDRLTSPPPSSADQSAPAGTHRTCIWCQVGQVICALRVEVCHITIAVYTSLHSIWVVDICSTQASTCTYTHSVLSQATAADTKVSPELKLSRPSPGLTPYSHTGGSHCKTQQKPRSLGSLGLPCLPHCATLRPLLPFSFVSPSNRPGPGRAVLCKLQTHKMKPFNPPSECPCNLPQTPAACAPFSPRRAQRTWVPSEPLVAVHDVAPHNTPVAVQGTHAIQRVCAQAAVSEQGGLEIDPVVHVAHPAWCHQQ
jgi:hypothetical protein